MLLVICFLLWLTTCSRENTWIFLTIPLFQSALLIIPILGAKARLQSQWSGKKKLRAKQNNTRWNWTWWLLISYCFYPPRASSSASRDLADTKNRFEFSTQMFWFAAIFTSVVPSNHDGQSQWEDDRSKSVTLVCWGHTLLVLVYVVCMLVHLCCKSSFLTTRHQA